MNFTASFTYENFKARNPALAAVGGVDVRRAMVIRKDEVENRNCQ